MESMQIIQESDQCMQDILENNQDDLNEFVRLAGILFPRAAAFISFAQARHFALKDMATQ